MANAQQLVIVVAAANPEPRTGFIDRAVVAAFDAGIEPILCITKTDVRYPQNLLDYYAASGLKIVLSSSQMVWRRVRRALPVWSRRRFRSFCRSCWVRCRCFWAIRGG